MPKHILSEKSARRQRAKCHVHGPTPLGQVRSFGHGCPACCAQGQDCAGAAGSVAL